VAVGWLCLAVVVSQYTVCRTSGACVLCCEYRFQLGWGPADPVRRLRLRQAECSLNDGGHPDNVSVASCLADLALSTRTPVKLRLAVADKEHGVAPGGQISNLAFVQRRSALASKRVVRRKLPAARLAPYTDAPSSRNWTRPCGEGE